MVSVYNISMFIQIGKCRFRFYVAAVVGLCHETILEGPVNA